MGLLSAPEADSHSEQLIMHLALSSADEEDTVNMQQHSNILHLSSVAHTDIIIITMADTLASSMDLLLDVLMVVMTCGEIGKNQMMSYLSSLAACKWTKSTAIVMNLLLLPAQKRKNSLISKRADMVDSLESGRLVAEDLVDLPLALLMDRHMDVGITEMELAAVPDMASMVIQSMVICHPLHPHMDRLITNMPDVIIAVDGLRMFYLLKDHPC